jgi:MFS family permease
MTAALSPAAWAAAPPLWAARACAAWHALLAHPVVNLPLGATVAGVACSAVGPVRSALVLELAPLQWLWRSLAFTGSASAPLATMQIGAQQQQRQWRVTGCRVMQ